MLVGRGWLDVGEWARERPGLEMEACGAREVLRVWPGGEEIQPEMCSEGLGANRALTISLGKAEGSADWTEPEWQRWGETGWTPAVGLGLC